jgi:hypothetical protein
LGGVQRLDRGQYAFSLKLGALEFDDLGGFAVFAATAFLAEMLVTEVFVAEVFTQGRLLLLNSRGIVVRKHPARERRVTGRFLL